MFGLKEKDYKGGFYLGKIIFPQNYPWAPPSLMLVTENGRIERNKSICLSISAHHKEQWDPVWSVRTIISGFISFFLDSKENQ